MSDIKEKIDMELKPYETICESTLDVLKSMITGGEEIDPHVIYDTAKTLGEIIDIKKDSVEMLYKRTIMEAMEKSEYGEDYDENGEIRRYYRGQPRSASSGRFMSRNDGRRGYEEYRPMEWDRPQIHYYMPDMNYYRDMDMSRGRMYYPESTGVSTSTGSGMPRQNPNEVANDRGMDSNEGNNRFYGGYSDNRGYQESKYERNRRMYTEMKNGDNSVESNKMKMDKLNEIGDNLDESLKTMLRGSTEQEKTAVKNRLMQIAQGIK